MNLLAAKITLQKWIIDEQVALFVDDAAGNFFELYNIAQDDDNQEIIEILNYIESTRMIENMLSNKMGA